VPIPGAPRIDALSQPNVAGAVDPGSLAKKFEAEIDPTGAARVMAAGPGLFIFVSLGIPEQTMQRLVEQAARARAVLVLRGLEKESIRDTVLRVQRLIGNRQVSFQIDPQAFVRYGIAKVPTFALVRAGAFAEKCAEHACMPGDSFASVAGDVSLDYALEHIQKNAPRFAREAGVFQSRLGRQR
jgi:conjugal transfer pilus assembly protein TrbC